jgi:outer membrane immunogenic protein
MAPIPSRAEARCPLLAQSGHQHRTEPCPLLGVKRTTGPNWLLGLEADFSFARINGRASSAPSILATAPQSTTAEQSTDWYGTVRGRVGWLATPNLLLFGTGGFAYGRTSASATYTNDGVRHAQPPFSFFCSDEEIPCFAGSGSAVQTGWTAGGGVEWLLDQHWSAKIEYQFVDLGTETIRVTSLAVASNGPIPSSFNAAFRDQFNVVRLGLNYRF